MHIRNAFAFTFLGSVFAIPQGGKGSPKGTSNSDAAASGGMLGAVAASMGLDPNAEITAMVCQSFSGGSAMGKLVGNMYGSPNGVGPDEQCMVDRSGGSGPYKAGFKADDTLPRTPFTCRRVLQLRSFPSLFGATVFVWHQALCLQIS